MQGIEKALNMNTITFPVPDPEILARREQIIAGIGRSRAPDALITSEDKRRPYESDALTALPRPDRARRQ